MSGNNPFSTREGGQPYEDGRTPPNVPGFAIIGDQPIGEGGMGVVWKARKEGLERIIALKVLKSWHGRTIDLQRANAEARTLASLQSPHIVPLFEFGWYGVEGARRPYFVMPLIKGEDLEQHVRSTDPSRSARATLLQQIIKALAAAHSPTPPIVHRDIKPKNIMITGDGDATVLDFGIADFAGPEELSNGPRGISYQWASPEQIGEWRDHGGATTSGTVFRESRLADRTLVQSEAHTVSAVGTASDVYSLGVVAYQLFNHDFRLPYTVDSTSPERILAIITQRPLPLPSLAGVRLGRVILKAMHPDVTARYRNAREFADDVDKALRGLMTTADPKNPVERTKTYIAQHRVPLGIAAVLLLGVAATTWQAVEANRQRTAAVTLGAKNLTLATAEQQARIRAEGMATSTDRAMEFIDQVLFSVDSYSANDKTINWDYVFAAAEKRLPTVKGDARAEAITLRAMGRIASNWGRHTEGAKWLQQSADLWKQLADQRDAPAEQQQKDASDAARTLNWYAWALSGGRKAKEAVAPAQQAYEVAAGKLGDKHQDTIAYRFDWAKMRLDSGDPFGGAQAFIDTLAVLSDKSPQDYVRWLIDQNHSIAELAREGKAAEAEERLRILLQPFLDSERPRIRARTPWSLAQAADKMAIGTTSVQFFFTAMASQYKLDASQLPKKDDLQQTGRLAAELAVKLARDMLPSGHPDISKTEGTRQKIAAKAGG